MSAPLREKRAVFLDRDGTLNIEKRYLYRREDWEWVPGAVDALTLLSSLGFELVVVTNQAGIARGYYGEDDVLRLHAFVAEQLERDGLRIAAFHHCPHHPEFSDECTCRKPHPGMLLRAAEDLGIDLAQSWMIGDKLIDVEAGQRAGARSILVRTGYGAAEEVGAGDTLVVDDVLAAARHIATQAG